MKHTPQGKKLLPLLLASAALTVVPGCGISPAGNAADAMLQASVEGDCERSAGYIDPPSASEAAGRDLTHEDLVEACLYERNTGPLVGQEITDLDDEKDTSSVEVRLTHFQNHQEIFSTRRIALARIDGEWKVLDYFYRLPPEDDGEPTPSG
ncbi:MAG: hypothetical protein C4534_00155 [Gaiellales bacterium]|nr:MAG: hypothetical protein C4534_00155 [Gaiellales bacterium]